MKTRIVRKSDFSSLKAYWKHLTAVDAEDPDPTHRSFSPTASFFPEFVRDSSAPATESEGENLEIQLEENKSDSHVPPRAFPRSRRGDDDDDAVDLLQPKARKKLKQEWDAATNATKGSLQHYPLRTNTLNHLFDLFKG